MDESKEQHIVLHKVAPQHTETQESEKDPPSPPISQTHTESQIPPPAPKKKRKQTITNVFYGEVIVPCEDTDEMYLKLNYGDHEYMMTVLIPAINTEEPELSARFHDTLIRYLAGEYNALRKKFFERNALPSWMKHEWKSV